MGLENHKIVDLAENQLRTSICLFFVGDLVSSITLAGAADVLLSQLVEKHGKENFTAFVLKSEDDPNKTIPQIGKEINDMFHINSLKHMDSKEDSVVTINLREAAVGAILKALPNYNILRGKDQDFIQSFLLWIQKNLDPKVYNVNCDPNFEIQKKS